MPGPLPQTNRRRRNAPTIPTTSVPVSGRKGPIPRPPKWIPLGDAGTAWWRWAWRTPAACSWSLGDVTFVARRAQLEDLIVMLEGPAIDWAALAELDGDVPGALAEFLDHVKYVVQRLQSLAAGRLSVLKEMRERDDRLGLNRKAFAALRLEVVADTEPEGGTATAAATRSPSRGRWGDLRVVESVS